MRQHPWYWPGLAGVIQASHDKDYRQVSNISRTLVGNRFVDHSDVVGEAPTGDAPTTSSFSTSYLAWANTTARRGDEHLRGLWAIDFRKDCSL